MDGSGRSIVIVASLHTRSKNLRILVLMVDSTGPLSDSDESGRLRSHLKSPFQASHPPTSMGGNREPQPLSVVGVSESKSIVESQLFPFLDRRNC